MKENKINQVASLFEKQAAVKKTKPTQQELRFAAQILRSWREYIEFRVKELGTPSRELNELYDLIKSGYHNASNALSILDQIDDI